MYANQALAPWLCRLQVVIMDNLAVHKVKGIREPIESRGTQLLYLLPYSPDLSPIGE
jgi:transposase